MKRNAFFQLIHKEDGMYLKSYPPSNGGVSLSIEDIYSYFDQRHLVCGDPSIIKNFVDQANQQTNALVKFWSEDILPEKEFPIITMDEKRTLAKIRLYPPSSKGQRITLEDLKSLVRQAGVNYGIIERNLEILWKARLYCTDILLARAKKPVRGKDAVITYHFDLNKTSHPQIQEDGSVDFHHLDMIESVREGQLLATLTPEEPGEAGMDVTGAAISPGKVKKSILRHGRNIHLSEDKLEMYSELSGNVSLVNNTVFVSDIYEVPGDVGANTGDIDYKGCILVKGNVLTGYKVKAEGDIIVNGVVEGAELKAGGKIILKSGIQGMQKGTMEAGGDVIANFIESSEVIAGGSIMTDAILHSKIIAQEEIIVQGKRGLIVGGNICSKVKIEAKTAGSTMGTMTELEVGFDPLIKEEYLSIEREMEMLSREKQGLLQNFTILKKRMDVNGGKLDKDKLILLQKSGQRLNEIEERMLEASARYDQLGMELGKMEEGRILIRGTAYPGVKLIIATISKLLKEEYQYSAFIRDGADVRVTGI